MHLIGLELIRCFFYMRKIIAQQVINFVPSN